MPFVVWATSSFGGWLGALVGVRRPVLFGGVGMLVIGAVLGGITGAAGWLWVMRRTGRTVDGRTPDESAEDTTAGAWGRRRS